MKHMVELMK